MKKSDLVKSAIASMIAGVAIYRLKKREERLFEKEYKNLQKKYQSSP